jgi:hypothetical protein
MKQYISLSALRRPFTPPSLEAEKPKVSPVIILREPTETESDVLGMELFRRNVAPVSQETIRATMVDEIYNLYSKPIEGGGLDESAADEKAGLLEEVWQHEGAYQAHVQLWQEQEIQRRKDKAAGAEVPEAEEFPVNACPMRTKAKSQLLIDDVTARSQRIRDLIVQQNSYEIVQRRMMSRLYIIDWKNLGPKPEYVEGEEGECLTEASLDRLWKELGPLGRREVEHEIERSFDLNEEERKNSDLPAGSGLEEIGSPQPSGAPANSDGSSIKSSSTPTPAAASEVTTAES